MAQARFHIQAERSVCTGDEFIANVLLDAPDAAINAAQGTLVYDPAQLAPVAVHYGGSFLRYWVTAPAVPEVPGEIPFVGGLPYPGFAGDGGLVMSVVFKARGENTETTLSFADDAQALLNDGEGTPADIVLGSADLALLERHVPACTTDAEKKIEILDTEPPAAFDLIITRSDKAFDGEYFAIFDTVDEGTGVDHFEVRETSLYRDMPWLQASSPYHLRTQGGQVLVEVRAVDGAGNVRYASASQELEPIGVPFGVGPSLVIAAAVLAAAVIFMLCVRSLRREN